jgi:hypothetical protein
MAKRKSRPQKASTTQRVAQIVGILIALSMILVLLAPLAEWDSPDSLPTPTPQPTATPEPTATPADPTPTPGAALAPTPDGGG